MTALGKYQRLECPGLWRAAPREQRRDVVVSFGDSSLVLADGRSGVPLTHWSLPAVTRRNPGEAPALYTPDAATGETLEVDDPDMIEALETVARSLRRNAGRRRGRLRRIGAVATLAVLAGLSAFWLPGALIGHATQVVPQPTRVEIGNMILDDLSRAGLRICDAPQGMPALAQLERRLLGPGSGQRLAVLGGAETPAVTALPGGLVVLGRELIVSQDSPEVAAGYILAADLAARGDTPLRRALEAAGLRATVMLLITGSLPAGSLDGHGAERLAAPPPSPAPEALLSRFAALGVASSPYAYARDPSGESTLIEADPFRDTASPRPVLDDEAWVSLQSICAD